MKTGTITLIGLAALAPLSAAHAGSVVAEQIFADDAGNALPGNLVTIRVYWQADDAGDQLVGVVGSPDHPMDIAVEGGVWFDSDHFSAGDRPPSFGLLGLPGFEELSYDSWFTIGNTSLDVGPAWPSGAGFSDEVIVAPGTSFDAEGTDTWTGGPGGPDNIAWTVPPSLDDPGGGGVQATPQSIAGNWAGNRVAIMQLTYTPDGGPGGSAPWGTFGLLVIEGGVAMEVQGGFEFPTPGTLVFLVIGAMTCSRRRRH